MASKHPRRPQDLFINRELSWLAFDERVLEEAQDPALPLLERLKFLCIFSTNLDEFFMVRVARLRKQMAAGVRREAFDGSTPEELYQRVCAKVRQLTARHQYTLMQDILPTLEKEGVKVWRYRDLSEERRKDLRKRFRKEILPVLTPLGLDPGHPFPHLLDRGLNLILELKRSAQLDKTYFAVLQLPSVLPRLLHIGRDKTSLEWILLEELVTANAADLFPGMHVLSCGPFRVTRTGELELEDELEQDLLERVQSALQDRPWSPAVRLQIPSDAADAPVGVLKADLGLEETEIFRVDGLLDVGGLFPLTNLDIPRLRRPPVHPTPITRTKGASIFRWIRGGDRLLHHPYDSFDPVVEFVSAAASDPKVLAIKQTLYRTSVDSPFIDALKLAAHNGKQVTVVVELKARFDEHANIQWAQELEEHGVHVVYGLLGLKIHAKATLVVRREDEGHLRRYAHLGTGNYHPKTARLYTDLGYLTADLQVTDEVAELFNFLTGYSQYDEWKRLAVAPGGLRKRLLKLIRKEAHAAKKKSPARIVAKMNQLEDPELIRALYDASTAGVPIDLVVRGFCCLRPGVPGLSETIRVRSVVGPFLEHSRAFYFHAGGDDRVFLGSADWMPRNMDRRVEVMLEVVEPEHKERILQEVVEASLADEVQSRLLLPDGSYLRIREEGGFDSQVTLAAGKIPKRLRGAPRVRGKLPPAGADQAEKVIKDAKKGKGPDSVAEVVAVEAPG